MDHKDMTALLKRRPGYQFTPLILQMVIDTRWLMITLTSCDKLLVYHTAGTYGGLSSGSGREGVVYAKLVYRYDEWGVAMTGKSVISHTEPNSPLFVSFISSNYK